MDTLRVCHVIHDTQCGGTESMLRKLIDQLNDGYDFRVLSLMGCGEIGRQIQDLGIPVVCLGLAESGRPRPWRLYRVVRELWSFKPHIVQTWGYHADLVGGVAAKLGTGVSILWNVRHATLDPAFDSKNVLRSARMCGRLSSWLPDRILLNSAAAVPVHQAAGYRHDKMQVIANGFDLQRFRPMREIGSAVRDEFSIPADDTLVGMCGRFHVHKGQRAFIRVAAELASHYTNLRFIMVGRGCDESNQELASWIQSANLASRVHLLGERSDIPNVLNAMDVFLLPSLTEGMPNVVGEAMACGVPVVATDVGDAGQLMGGHGILVPPQDHDAMTQAVDSLLALPDLKRRALGVRSRHHISENYALDVIANQYATAWRAAWEKKRSPSSRTNHALTATSAVRAGKPKLVHVTTIPLTQYLFLRGQLPFMAEQGFDVHCVSSPGDYLKRIDQRDPVTVHPVRISRQIRPLQDVKTVYELFRLFRRLRPEIVQLSTPKAALLGAIAARLASVPIRIYQVRGLSSESETGLKRWLFQRLERLTANLCNAHLVNAHSLMTYAQNAKILRAGIVAGLGMSNGVDLDRFRPDTVEPQDLRTWDAHWDENVGPVIGFVGRLTYDKGLEDIYRAWMQLRMAFPKARLLLVGPWESENSVSRECRDGLQNDPRVILPGAQDNVAPFYKCIDVFVYPSHGTEGFPNAPMEAAAMELPVIATRVVGCVDAVSDGQTGRIVSPRAPEELEAQLRTYLSNPQLRKQHGRAGRERIRTGFAPSVLWQAFLAYYIHLLRRSQLDLPQGPTRQEERRAA